MKNSLLTLTNKTRRAVFTGSVATYIGISANMQVFAATDPNCDPLLAGSSIKRGVDCAIGTPGNTDNPTLFGPDGIFSRVINALLFLVGAISVVMLIVGGIRYVISSGDQNAVTAAKNTILYAIIGLVISFLAFAAVRFVTGALDPTAI